MILMIFSFFVKLPNQTKKNWLNCHKVNVAQGLLARKHENQWKIQDIYLKLVKIPVRVLSAKVSAQISQGHGVRLILYCVQELP